MKLSKELVAASSVPVVLSVLAGGESYGYAIIERVRELSGGEIEWSDGMLYPVLHWMEEQGYIKGRWGASEAGRKRKYYSLEKGGSEALQNSKDQWTTVDKMLRQLWRHQHV
jgi:DNA-binding PadR family transcriptional regulator